MSVEVGLVAKYNTVTIALLRIHRISVVSDAYVGASASASSFVREETVEIDHFEKIQLSDFQFDCMESVMGRASRCSAKICMASASVLALSSFGDMHYCRLLVKTCG